VEAQRTHDIGGVERPIGGRVFAIVAGRERFVGNIVDVPGTMAISIGASSTYGASETEYCRAARRRKGIRTEGMGLKAALDAWRGRRTPRGGTISGTWIDVGAHHGETTLPPALLNAALKVYAFEPNLLAAAKLVGQAPNYFVVPMAVAEEDGFAQLHINEFEAASSLLAIIPNPMAMPKT